MSEQRNATGTNVDVLERPAPGRFTGPAAALPAEALVIGGMFSVQFGAALAKSIFDDLSPAGVIEVRLAAAAVILLLWWRPRLRGHSRSDLLVAGAFAVALAGMNLAFYESIARIPIGVSVTVEYLGPLAVAIAGSRRRIDVLWIALAASGVFLLAQTDPETLDLWGVVFAGIAGIFWAAYIGLSKTTGRRFAGGSGLALAMAGAAVIDLPFGLAGGGLSGLTPTVLAIGAAVGVLSSVVPYSLELRALRTMRPGVFGLLLSLAPAIGAIAGLVVLHELLGVWEWCAIAAVVLACIGSGRSARELVS